MTPVTWVYHVIESVGKKRKKKCRLRQMVVARKGKGKKSKNTF